MGRYNEESLLPLSGLQHFAFCKRQWALIHIERQWDDNLSTVEGHHLHEKVHSGLHTEAHGEIIVARSVPVVSYVLGLHGVADLIEYHRVDSARGVILPNRNGFWRLHPVEYKRGRPKRDDRDEVQLCAQAMCLEEMLGIKIAEGSFFYGRTRRRLKVAFTRELRERVADLAREMHELFAQGVTPAAPPGTPCQLCSLKDLCVPKLTRRRKDVAEYVRRHIEV